MCKSDNAQKEKHIYKGKHELQCLICSNTFWVKPSHATIRKCCSRKCGNIYKSGENSPNWKNNKVDKTCPVCEKEFKVRPLFANRIYCSIKCAFKDKDTWFRDVKKGQEHPLWDRVIKNCLNCNKEFFVKKCEYDRRKCCSLKCTNRSKLKYTGEEKLNLRQIRSSGKYKRWRKQILKRDGCCVLCGSMDRLEADHIKSFIAYPELRFDLENGRTLCRNCHKQTDNYGGKSRNIYQQETK